MRVLDLLTIFTERVYSLNIVFTFIVYDVDIFSDKYLCMILYYCLANYSAIQLTHDEGSVMKNLIPPNFVPPD